MIGITDCLISMPQAEKILGIVGNYYKGCFKI